MQDTLAIMSSLARELITSADDLAQVDALLVAGRAGGESGVTAILELARLTGEAADKPGDVAAALDRAASLDPFTRVACLVTACFAAVRADYPSRQDAQTARALISARAEAAYADAGAFGADLVDWLVSLAGITVLHLSRTATERAPAVRVETGVSLPATLLAYDLYGSAARAGEIVDRNGVGTSLIMPVSFEALAE